MKSLISSMLIILLLGICSKAFSDTSLSECLGLRGFSGSPVDVLKQNIEKYNNILKSNPSGNYANLALGILYFEMYNSPGNTDTNAVNESIGCTEKFLEKDMDNPIGLLYNGLAHGIIARNSKDIFVKIKEGPIVGDELDRAVKHRGLCGEFRIQIIPLL